MKDKIDMNRVRRAMNDIDVKGSPHGKVRLNAIEAAIAAISTDGEEALSREYIGVKNYAAFGDQREDHQYGMGPRHGAEVELG